MAVKVKHATTVANAVSTVNYAFDTGQVAVYNFDGTENLFVRVDGTDPTIEGDDSYAVPVGSRRVITVETDGNTVVKAISAGVVKFEVEAA